MRVAVVDPSRTVLKCVARLLQRGQHEALLFVDGPEALAHIRSDPAVGALIISAELPSMSGVELCWEARLLASGRRPIYILLMSSNQERHMLVEALDSGADDFIGKPPIPEELHARLRSAERMASMQLDLIRLATTDPLTGALNRRAFFEQAATPIARADVGEPLCAIMFDIDHFKRINDTFGHDAGDEAIRTVAKAAMAEEAIVGRMGGEEFAMLLPGRRHDATVEMAERLRQQLEGSEIATHGQVLTLTCSFGVAEREAGEPIDRLLTRADVALYAAKTSGRNRVVAAADAPTVPGYDPADRTVRSGARSGGAGAAETAAAPLLRSA